MQFSTQRWALKRYQNKIKVTLGDEEKLQDHGVQFARQISTWQRATVQAVALAQVQQRSTVASKQAAVPHDAKLCIFCNGCLPIFVDVLAVHHLHRSIGLFADPAVTEPRIRICSSHFVHSVRAAGCPAPVSPLDPAYPAKSSLAICANHMIAAGKPLDRRCALWTRLGVSFQILLRQYRLTILDADLIESLAIPAGERPVTRPFALQAKGLDAAGTEPH